MLSEVCIPLSNRGLVLREAPTTTEGKREFLDTSEKIVIAGVCISLTHLCFCTYLLSWVVCFAFLVYLVSLVDRIGT